MCVLTKTCLHHIPTRHAHAHFEAPSGFIPKFKILNKHEHTGGLERPSFQTGKK